MAWRPRNGDDGPSESRVSLQVAEHLAADDGAATLKVGEIQRSPESGLEAPDHVELGADHRTLLPGRTQEFVVVSEDPRALLKLEQPLGFDRNYVSELCFDSPSIGPDVGLSFS